MGSLTTCLKKTRAGLAPGDEDAIVNAAADLRDTGLKASEAAQKAVRDLLAVAIAARNELKPAPDPVAAPAAPRNASMNVGDKKYPATVMGSRLLAVVNKAGGLSPSLISEFSERVTTTKVDKKTGKLRMIWRNPMVPKGFLFRAGGTSDYSRLGELMEENGYLPPGTAAADYKAAGEAAKDMIKAALISRKEAPTQDDVIADAQASQDAERDAYYAELEAEAAREAEAEREAIIAESSAPVARIDDMADDDVPWDAVGTVGSDQDAAAFLGITIEEFQREQGRVQGAVRQDEPAQAGRGEGDPADAGRAAGPTAEAGSAAARDRPAEEGLTLEEQTPADLQAKAEREQAAADRERKQRTVEQERLRKEAEGRDLKARADQTLDSFELGQSADQQMSGMGDMFADAPAEASAPAEDAKPAPVAAAKPEPASSARLTDAGEELIRNRRGKLKGLAWADVSAMNDTLKVAQVIKANVWPRPDYAKMVEDGAPAWKAAAFKAVYDKLAAAPVTRGAPTDADLKDYIETLHQVRDALTAELDRVAALPDGKELWKTLQARNVFGKVFPIPADARPVYGAPSPFDRVSEQGKANNRRALMIGGNAAVQAMQFGHRTLSKIKDLLAEGFPAKQEAWQKSYEVRQTETRNSDVPEAERTGETQQRFYVYEKDSRYRLAKGMQDGGYKTQEQAEAFARTLTTKKREVLPPSRGLDLADAKRTGPDWRNGKDVTAQDIMDRFGFRGVNLGEYVKAKQGMAQQHLNHVFDAFSDLADLLGVPPKAMSLNGTLGVAIGAQGSGKALAHFVPGVNEINITRDSGAGALAHEFGHAMDHYFAAQHGKAVSMAKRPYLSAVVEGINDSGGVRPELMAAMREVIKTINARPMTEGEARKYLTDQRELNQRRLDRWVKEFKGNKGADPAALDAVAEKLKRGDIGEPQDGDVEANLSEFMRASGLKPGNAIASNAFSLAYRLRDLADEARFLARHVPQVDTDYAKASAAMDAKKTGDGYWSTPWEKFARAFETFAMDALKDRQRESLYLSGLVDSEGWRSWAAETGKAMPFPAGDERLALQQAFQKLVDTIQTREDDAGNVALLSQSTRSPKGVPAADLRRMVDALSASWKGLRARPEVVATAADLPQNIVDALRSMNALGTTRGLRMPDGKVYLIANKLDSMKEAQAVLFHEVLGHEGLRAFLGDSYTNMMGALRMANPALAAEANTWYARFGQDQIVARVEAGMSRADAGALVRALAVEEALADRAGDGVVPKAWKSVMAALQRALRRIKGMEWIADWLESKTEAETYAVLMGARRAIERGAGDLVERLTGAEPAQSSTPLFSRAPNILSEAFRRWFGSSVIANPDGTPRVMYHGTGADIRAFRGQQAGAIFLTDEPIFAQAYANASAKWLNDRGQSGGENILPVYVKAENPFDYDNPKHVDALVDRVFKQATTYTQGDGDKALVLDGKKTLYTPDVLRYGLTEGKWSLIEMPEIQAAIKAAGHDSFYVNEDDFKNLAVYKPTQVKSAIGNRGTFDPTNADITLSQVGQTPPAGQVDALAQSAAADPTSTGVVIPGASPGEQAAISRGYRHRVRSVIKRIDHVVNGLGGLPDSDQYMAQRYLALGKIANIDKVVGRIREVFKSASAADKKRVYEFLTDRDYDAGQIEDTKTRETAQTVKGWINTIGAQLVDRGLLSEETREEYRDRYLPRLYLSHLLDEGDWRSIGVGKKVSDMGYLKRRKDIPQEVRDVLLGEIKDPAFLASVAMAKPIRDMALLDWLEQISEHETWVFPNSLAEWEGRRVSVFWLKAEAASLRNRARYYPEGTNREKAAAIAESMDALAQQTLGEADRDHTDFKRIPDTPQYGRMRGILVRKEIYNDLLGTHELMPKDPGWAESLLGYGGIGTRITQMWKASKVSLNIPGQVRNVISNAVLLQLSGVPLHKFPFYIANFIRSYRVDGGYWKIAQKYGVTESTFATIEVFRSKRDLLELETEMRGMSPWRAIKTMAAILNDKAGDVYQSAEAMFKTIKIMDEIERNNATEEAAALEAQKWLFDYSLLDQNIRYLRNAPLGAPFLTFTTKVLPRLAEVALLHPQRFLPWIGLHFGIQAMAAATFGGDDDEWERLKKALPKWMHDKNHVAFLPWRDDAGRLQAMDLSYYFPWSQYAEAAGSLSDGDPIKAAKNLGIFGGPLSSVAAAITTGRDPFTQRDIVNPGDPVGYKAMAITAYVWDLAMPPMMSSQGVVSPLWLMDPMYGGKVAQATTGATNRYGDERATMGQAIARLAGANVYGVDPNVTRQINLAQMRADVQKAMASMRSKLGNQGLSPERQKAIREQYMEEVRLRQKKLAEYAKESTPPQFAKRVKEPAN